LTRINGEILNGLTANEARTLRRLLTKLLTDSGSSLSSVPRKG
jgi:hypothetical protein